MMFSSKMYYSVFIYTFSLQAYYILSDFFNQAIFCENRAIFNYYFMQKACESYFSADNSE